MVRCRAVVGLASGVGALWLLTCGVGWADGASAQSYASRGATFMAVGAPGIQAPTAAEGWTSFSHWHRNANGTITNDVYAAPTFSDAGGSWHAVAEAVKSAVGVGAVSATADLVRPVQFGNDQSHLETLMLDSGPVTISAPQLSISLPSATTASSVEYSSVASNTDLWYLVNPHAVVEDLVLKSASAPTSFTFHISDPSHALGELHTHGESAHFSSLVDGDVQIGLAAPFAYEESSTSNPVRDGAIPVAPGSAHMTVTPAGDGWDVTESVDASWLKGKSYPIVLDPTITLDHASGTMIAGWIANVPSGCGGGCATNTTSSDLGAGTYTDSTYDWEPGRSVFQFDLSSIPIGSQVSSAALNAYTIGCLGNPNGGPYYCNQHDYTVELHPLTGPWTTSSTYDQLTAITDASVFSSLHQSAFTVDWHPPCTGCFWENFDVTSEAQSWVNSPSTNYGFIAKTQTEPYSIGGPYWSYLGTQGGGNGYSPPYLSVTYTPSTVTPGGETLGGDNPSEPGVFQCVATDYPVNCATGDLYHTFTDISVPGRGFPLELDRTYNSLAAGTNGPFGYGWTSSYNMSLTVSGGGAVTISQENGSQVTFIPASGGTYTAPPRVIASLVKNADGTYTFTRGKRERFTFSSAGLLTGETDLNGYTTTLSYTATQLSRVADPAGRTLTFTYGTNGDVASVADSGGRTVSYGYDPAGNLTSVVDVGGGTTHFTYDANHLLLTMIDPRGGTTTNTYDSSARVTAQLDPMNRQTTFAYGASSTTVTDPNGNAEVQNYTSGLLTSVTRGAGSPQAATWRFSHDSPTGAVTSVTDPNGHTSTATYDAQANVLTRTDALGRTTTYTYDALDDVTSVTDPAGHVTSFTYDVAGNLLSKSQSVTETGQTARTVYAYGDSSHPGDLTGITDPTGGTWSYGYDTYGDRTRTVDPLGDTTTSVFDVLGRRTASVSPKGNVTGADPSSFTWSYTYDPFGDVLTRTDPLGDRTINTYDGDGNRISSTDPGGHRTNYAYNADNELISISRADGSATSYGYDGDGNRISWTDGNGNVTHYAYDSLDRQTSTTDPLGRITSQAYDGVGNPVTVTDASGQTTTFTYDAADELVGTTYSDGNTPNVTFTYNVDGQIASESSAPVARTYTYDSLNRLLKTSETDVLRPSNGGPLPVDKTINYGYDLASRVTSLGITLQAGNLINRSFSRTYDAAGRMSAVSDGLGNSTSFVYDANGNVVSEIYANGITATYRYDNADQIGEIRDANAAGVTLLSLPYTRNANSLVTSDNASGTAAGPTRSFVYDQANRLASATPQPTGVANLYTYDLADNRTGWTAATGTSTYTYDQANELTAASIQTAGQSSTASFGYDNRGNRIAESDTLGNHIGFGYDQANRLVSYQGPATSGIGQPPGTQVSQAAYQYDASGLWANLTWDLADGTPLIVADLANNTYVTGPDGLPVERVDAAGGAVYYHQDQLGSTRALTGPSGALLITYTYDPYGNAMASNTSVANAFQFAGQYVDSSTGLIYMRARWYDPSTGAFISVDPALGVTNEAYAYAYGDPANHVDPTGLCSMSSSTPWPYGSTDECQTIDFHSPGGSDVFGNVTWCWRGAFVTQVTVWDLHQAHQTLLKAIMWRRVGVFSRQETTTSESRIVVKGIWHYQLPDVQGAIPNQDGGLVVPKIEWLFGYADVVVHAGGRSEVSGHYEIQ